MAKVKYINDRQWEIISKIIPERAASTGRKRVNDRWVLEGILHVLFLQLQWMELPQKDYPSYTTCFRRYTAWVKAGVWEEMTEALFDDLRDRTGIDLWKLHARKELYNSDGLLLPEGFMDSLQNHVEVHLFLLAIAAQTEDQDRRRVKS